MCPSPSNRPARYEPNLISILLKVEYFLLLLL